MRNLNCTKNSLLAFTLLAALLMSPLGLRGAIVTNWVAFNDHRPGPIPPPAGQWGTARRVTGYDMRVGPAGNLTNFLNGQQLAVTLSVTPNGSPDDFGTCVEPNDNTPAPNPFKGIVDVANTHKRLRGQGRAHTYLKPTLN